MDGLFSIHKIGKNQSKRISSIHHLSRNKLKTMTEEEKNRKQIVHSKIFYYEQMTPLQMNLVIYILRDFKKYVLLFQLEKP